MKKFFTTFLAGLFLTAQVALANFITPITLLSSGSTDIAIDFVDCYFDESSATIYTISAGVGAASSNRTNIIGIGARDDATVHSITSVTVGGDSATELYDDGAASQIIGMAWYKIANPAGTTEDIVITNSEALAAGGGVYICVWAVTNLGDVVEMNNGFNVNSDPYNIDVSVSDGGAAFGFAITSGGAAQTAAWTGLTEDDDDTTPVQSGVSGASLLSASLSEPLAITQDHSGVASSYAISISFLPDNAADPTISFIGCTNDLTDQITYTFAAQNTGTAGANRSTIVGIASDDAAATYTISSVTVGGDAATIVVDEDASFAVNTAVAILDNPSGTSESIVVTGSEALTAVTICVWAAYDLTFNSSIDTAEPSDTSGSAMDGSVDVSAHGIAVGMHSLGSATTSTWAGLTERADASDGTELSWSAADVTEDATGSFPLTIQVDDDAGATDRSASTASFR
jgi:hypothetical protein